MSLRDNFINSKKLICPNCNKEVNEYPPKNMLEGKFNCLNCNSNIKFIQKNGLFIIWETDKL